MMQYFTQDGLPCPGTCADLAGDLEDARCELAGARDEIASLERQLAHYRASLGGTALDWMGRFMRAPMWVRVLMAVTVRRSRAGGEGKV
jgi:hypothetical protein